MALKVVIISGGQSGADRAALDFAIKHDIPHGGWCPHGRKALDGPIDARYKLKETPSDDELERIEWNVRDSDATVVLTLADKPKGAAQKSASLAKKTKKPCIHLHRAVLGVSGKLVDFIDKYYIRRLNVVGSSEADEPGIYDWATASLEKTKAMLDGRPD